MRSRDHISDEVLQDYVEQRLDLTSTAKVRLHVSICPTCATELAYWDRLIPPLREAARYAVPEPVLQRALAIFDRMERKPTFRERILAALVFDSRRQPLLAGARDLQHSSFKLLYEADGAHIDILCERDSSAWTLAGQVLSNARPDLGWRISVHHDGLSQTISVDRLGEFRLHHLEPGEHALSILSADREIVLPSIYL